MSDKSTFTYIVVGSGPSAAMAAQSLVEAGKETAILDVGYQDKKYAQLIPDGDFESIRKTDPLQHRYFLGDDYEAMPWDEIKVGAQLTPARKAMIKGVNSLLPLKSTNFLPMESLGYGGLGAGWGLGAYVYSEAELEKCGIQASEINPSYQRVADRIGISAGEDAVRKYIVGDLKNIQAPLKMDDSFKKIHARYLKKQEKMKAKGFYFGHPSMAILTKGIEDRKATKYEDMEFYTDKDKSAYRAQFTIDKLKSYSNFTYIPNQLVTHFEDDESGVDIHTVDVESHQKRTFRAAKFILTAGALGSARIVLRSFPKLNHLPILSNAYAYMPGIQPSMLGSKLGNKTSMAQAMMIYDPDGSHSDLVSVALFTYSSLLLFKLIKEAPLNFREGRALFQYLQSSFVIAGIHHPDSANGSKTLSLVKDQTSLTQDALRADFVQDSNEAKRILQREKKVRNALISLGVIPISRMAPEYGGSIHYAGTLPFLAEEKEGFTATDGRLHKTHNVYVADSSSFKYLPAKGITLSLMANADRVIQKIL